MNVYALSAVIEVRYIFALACVSLFAVLCFVYLIFYIKNKKKSEERLQGVLRMYENRANKFEYDCAPYDAETQRLLSERKKDGQLTIDDVMLAPVHRENEEITGRYKPES